MKHIYFTAGPSQIYPSVPKYIQEALDNDIPSMSHRGEAFQKLFTETRDLLKKLLNIPEENHIYFLASANEAWERIIQNCVEKNSFHFVNGAFGKRFFEVSQELKKTAEATTANHGESFYYKHVKIPDNAELICLTHNESSTGVQLNISDIYNLKKQNPDKLFALDTVSSAPYVHVDYSLIDCVYFSVQKGFGLPAGLAVIILTPAAIEKAKYLRKKGENVGSYHSFFMLEKFAQKKQTPETPNVLDIYLFNKIIKEMLNIGIKSIRDETDKKAAMFNKFFENNNQYSYFVKNPDNRSKTVFVMKTPGPSADTVARIKEKGFILGKGYGPYKEEYVRISNFPAHTIENVKSLIECL